MSFRTLDDMGDVRGKRVLVREDLNVPVDGARVTDDTRLRAAAPTVAELADKGAIVLVLAHFGRPKGERKPDMSLAMITKPFSDVLGREVRFIDDCCGAEAAEAVATLKAGDIAVLENTRFHKGEEKNDPDFIKLTSGGNPLKEVNIHELQKRLNEAMMKLSEDHRTVVSLYDIQGLQHADISKILGVSEGTVRSRLFYAHRQLQNYLEEFRR